MKPHIQLAFGAHQGSRLLHVNMTFDTQEVQPHFSEVSLSSSRKQQLQLYEQAVSSFAALLV